MANINYEKKIGAFVTCNGKEIGMVISVAPLVIMALSSVEHDGKMDYLGWCNQFCGIRDRENAQDAVDKFHTEGTMQGDWHLPTIAELRLLRENYDTLDQAMFDRKIRAYNEGDNRMWNHFLGLPTAIKIATYHVSDGNSDDAYYFERDRIIELRGCYLTALPILNVA